MAVTEYEGTRYKYIEGQLNLTKDGIVLMEIAYQLKRIADKYVN